MQTAAYTLVKRFGVKDPIFRRASFELAANMTQRRKVTSSPSCDEINLANATILENVKDITNTSMRDVDEILGTAVEMGTVGIKGEIFRIHGNFRHIC